MRWLMEHPGLKLVSLALAAVVWFFVRGITNETRTVANVPLEIRVKPGKTLLRSSVTVVRVVISGTREDVRQTSRADLLAELDLSRDDRTGDWQAPLRVRAIQHPPQVQVVQVEPAQVTVRIGNARPPDAGGGTGQGSP